MAKKTTKDSKEIGAMGLGLKKDIDNYQLSERDQKEKSRIGIKDDIANYKLNMEGAENYLSRLFEGYIVWRTSEGNHNLFNKFVTNTDPDDHSTAHGAVQRLPTERVVHDPLANLDKNNIEESFLKAFAKFSVKPKELRIIDYLIDSIETAKTDLMNINSLETKKKLSNDIMRTQLMISIVHDGAETDILKNQELVHALDTTFSKLETALEAYRKKEVLLYDFNKSKAPVFEGTKFTSGYNEDFFQVTKSNFKSFLKKHNRNPIVRDIINAKTIFDLTISTSELMEVKKPKHYPNKPRSPFFPGSQSHIDDVLTNSEPLRLLRLNFVDNFRDKIKAPKKTDPKTEMTAEMDKRSAFMRIGFIKIRKGSVGDWLNNIGRKHKDKSTPNFGSHNSDTGHER